jgi:putative ABC transport system permease protein
MIVGTIIVFQQVKFMRSQDLGANINQTLVVSGASSIQDSVYQNLFQPFKNDVLQTPGVKNVTVSSSVPGKEIYWTNGISRIGPDHPGAITLYHLGIDYDFIPAYDIHILKGRNFSKEFGTDKKMVLLNEAAVDELGFKSTDDAVGGKLSRGGDTATVIGVVKNFHQEGLKRNIEPLIILLSPNQRNNYSIKLSTNNLQATIASLEKTWSKHFPNDPFKFFFLDEFFDSQYKSDRLYGKVFGLFASLAILIACFGLLGLSAYNILQRTKEIGIRKVLGASAQNLLALLSRDFMKLVGIAFVIAIPVAWWIMNNWLQEFAYRIHIQWWVFAIAGIGAALIALGTISFQAIKAIIANPVNSLRNE